MAQVSLAHQTPMRLGKSLSGRWDGPGDEEDWVTL
jgi:hypothetical protein